MTRLRLQLQLDTSSTSTTQEYDNSVGVYHEEQHDEDEDYEEAECGFDGGSRLIGLEERQQQQQQQSRQLSFMGFVATALRKSLVTCAVDPGEDVCSSMDIGWPTDVREIAHVTFDRFNGFLGLPVELETELPVKVPSASASVFGVSADLMQCSYDNRGNSVPTILLLMQKHLYSQGGLQAEGIFRINGENGQELHVRDQLNKGIVPEGVDPHCLACLIKAWFRELPSGILDILTPDQVMHCNKEEECSHLVSLLPPMEAALLDWAINLMADVVQHERDNKMNARNIAMVFAPNMTQMADPLTALTHVVHVMNLLKTLVMMVLRERNAAAAEIAVIKSCSESSSCRKGSSSTATREKHGGWFTDRESKDCIFDRNTTGEFATRSEPGSQSDLGESFHSFAEKSEADEDSSFVSQNCSPVVSDKSAECNTCDGGLAEGAEGLLDRFSFRKRVGKLFHHPMLQLSKSLKKSRDIGNVNSRGEGEISCA